MKKKLLLGIVSLVIAAGGIVSVRAQDPPPYAAIAIPLADTLDQIVRDSATIRLGKIRLNQAGYRPGDKKYFYYVSSSGGNFSVIDVNSGASAATGTLSSKNVSTGSQIKIRASNNASLVSGGDTRYIMESAAVAGTIYEGEINITTPGRYKIRVGSEESGAFVIDENVYGWVRDAAIKFPGVNRCGASHSWFHGDCHLKDATPGGWHDCGDHLKEGITQSYLHFMLALASAALQDHDVDNYGRNHNNTRHTDGIPDVLYEAKHGSDYILAAFDNAGGSVNSRLYTSIANFGHDHMWWGQPEFHDQMPMARGGPPRESRNELGANILGLFSAGLSLTARNYAVYDSAYAARSIAAAKALYEYARVNQENTETPAYNGNGESQDKLAAAALGLLYATKDKKYLNDLCYDKSIFNEGSTEAFPLFGFEGGWFAKQPQFSKGFANTDWGSSHMAVLWGFYRLILKDKQMCDDIGIRSGQRDTLLTRVVGQILFNIEGISNPTSTQITEIQLPWAGQWGTTNPVLLKYDETWKYMHTQMDWMWNRYQFGNIFDLFAYSDLALWLEAEDVQLIGRTGSTNWQGSKVRQLVIRQMDYMLGNNPWDISMIYGVGHKNSNHPHHRAANPEGKNVPGAFYGYRPPVGALHSGPPPKGGGRGWTVQGFPSCQSEGGGSTATYCEHYDDYFNTETGIDASATMIVPLMGLSKPDPITDPPTATVRTVYVGFDRAIIEVRQSRFGMSTIRYGEEGSSTIRSESGDSNGVFHRIELTNLKGATKYEFDALVADMFGNEAVILNELGEKFSFTTLNEPAGDAEITNVKVCKVTADSAEIFWYTPNGAYDSKVVYGTSKPVNESNGMVQDQNIYGRPTQFHYVKIGGLKEKTTYYFYVDNNGTRDDNGGQFYEFTTPVTHVEFDVRVLKYSDQFFGLNIVNHDVKAYDSLELRIYLRAPDSVAAPIAVNGNITQGRRAFSDYVGMRVDIGIKYRSDGYQDTHFKTEIDSYVQRARPVRIADTYDPADNTWAFYIPIPMGPAEMQSGARFRIDMMFDTRSPFSPFEDLMNDPPPANILNIIWNGWSFVPHSRANGDPVDYPGVPTGGKDDIDLIYHLTPINPYVTVYRKNEFVWGYSPSKTEQDTKKTHYSMISQVTAPVFNPSEEYLYMEQVMPQITVNAWAQITDENGNSSGEINDVWVNGVRIRDVSSVASFNRALDRWDLTIPVPVRNGGNNVDITLFGGPGADCAECYGCTFSNHSFYLEFKGADPYPSSIKLLSERDVGSSEVRDSAVVGETNFYIYVDDENGNLNKDARDTLYASVVNRALGDSITVMLIETGNETGQFISRDRVSVVAAGAAQRPTDIPMDAGQTIRISYTDPTDPTDRSQTTLATRPPEFPIPVEAWFMDQNGLGNIDKISVRFSRELTNAPDSIRLTIPGMSGSDIGVAEIGIDGDDKTLTHFTFNPGIVGKTGFSVGEYMSARIFLRYSGGAKDTVISPHIDEVRDSAGPVLLDRAMLKERTGGRLDTVRVIFSEPIYGTKLTGNAIYLRRDGAEDRLLNVVGPLRPLVLNEIFTDFTSNTMTLIIDPDGNAIRERDSLYINPSGPTTDAVDNKAYWWNKPVPVELESAPPKAESAFYADADANGHIDRIELQFSKPVEINNNLRIWLSWENGRDVQIDRANMSQSGRTIVADIADMGLTGDAVVTSGSMRVTISHTGVGLDTAIAAADRAAPVVKSAQYRPGPNEDMLDDTLVVAFSERLAIANMAKQFQFLYTENGTEYVMTLQTTRRRDEESDVHTFIVTGIEGNIIDYPGEGDSIWINTKDIDEGISISDPHNNTQVNEKNRRVRMTFKPVPLSFDIKVAPNPFTPDPTDDRKRARIIVTPRMARTEINIKGSITIYDRMGNLVKTDDLKRDPDSRDLIYEWNGFNKHDRKVGSGTYLAMLQVEYVQEAHEEKVPPVKGRKLIYLTR